MVNAPGNAPISTVIAVDACTLSTARLARLLTVAATDQADTRPSYSNYGPCVDLFAPGDDIYSPSYASGITYELRSGTSMATPHAGGTAAVMSSRNPDPRHDRVGDRHHRRRHARNRRAAACRDHDHLIGPARRAATVEVPARRCGRTGPARGLRSALVGAEMAG